MRIYHLSDLHFGKSAYGLSMLESGDQKYWVDQFIGLCGSKRPDVIVIAGDVYDRSSPSGDAVELLDYMLTELAEMNIPVMLVAGNHDNGQRLSFARSFLARRNIHVAGEVKREIDHVALSDERGEVVFWLLPYLFPDLVSRLLEDENIRTYDQAIRALLSAQDIDWTKRNVLVAHQNVVADGKEADRGGSESMIGGVGQIDYTAFDGFDYVALGHIHSGYSVGRDEVRYAGTPLCYHMHETRQGKKGAVMVELGDKGEKPVISTEPIEPLHRMRFLSGTKQEIIALLKEDKGHDEYIGVEISDERITPETDRYLRGLLSSRGSLLLDIHSSYYDFKGGAVSSATRIRERSLEELFSDLYREQSAGSLPEDDEYELIRAVAELVRNQDCHEPIRPDDIDKIVAVAKKGAR